MRKSAFFLKLLIGVPSQPKEVSLIILEIQETDTLLGNNKLAMLLSIDLFSARPAMIGISSFVTSAMCLFKNVWQQLWGYNIHAINI